MSHEYKCSRCGAETRRELLVVKKVLFTGMGSGAKTHRSRVLDWLCPACTKRDPVYNSDSYRPVQEKVMPNAS